MNFCVILNQISLWCCWLKCFKFFGNLNVKKCFFFLGMLLTLGHFSLISIKSSKIRVKKKIASFADVKNICFIQNRTYGLNQKNLTKAIDVCANASRHQMQKKKTYTQHGVDWHVNVCRLIDVASDTHMLPGIYSKHFEWLWNTQCIRENLMKDTQFCFAP